MARIWKTARQRDLMHVTGMVVAACRADKPSRVKIDDIGLGGGVTDRLRELQASEKPDDAAAREALKGVEIVPVNVGEAPATDIADARFKNLRAEINWGARLLFTESKVAIDANDDLAAQATQIKYKLTSSSEIQIESKADMKKRTGGVSPDDWDSFCLAFAAPSFPGSGLLEWYKRQAEAKQGAEAEAGKPKLAPTVSTGGVRLKAPVNTSTVYGMSGNVYQVRDGEIVTSPDDAKPLLGQGFEKV